ncbi:MAG: hypothetical protein KC925_01435 [Candidatus Doudnabacteria bacterium]|nr:hypothetical protein [Candidatus Doudnabacteria bacterium]
MPEVLNWAQARFLSDNRNTVSWVLNRTPPPPLGEVDRDRAQIEFADLVTLGAITTHHMVDGDSVASVMSENAGADLELPPHVTVVAQASMGGVAAALKLRGACTPELELAADAATTNVEVWDSVSGDALMVLEAIKGTPRGKDYYDIFSQVFNWWMAGCSAKDPVVATFKAHQQAFVDVVAATSAAQALDRFSVLEDDDDQALTPDVAWMCLALDEPYVLSQIGRAFWVMNVGPQRALVVQRADSLILSVMVRRDQQDIRALLRLSPGLGYYTRFPLHGDHDVVSQAIQMAFDIVDGKSVDMDLFNELVGELEEARKAHEAAIREADESRRLLEGMPFGDRRPRRHERPSKPAHQPRNEGFNPQLREKIALLLPQLKAQLAALQG